MREACDPHSAALTPAAGGIDRTWVGASGVCGGVMAEAGGCGGGGSASGELVGIAIGTVAQFLISLGLCGSGVSSVFSATGASRRE